MVQIKLYGHNVADRHLGPLVLDVEDGTTARDVLLQSRNGLCGISETLVGKDLRREGQEGVRWRLRARRSIEEARWWTETEVLAFRDRTYLSHCFVKHDNMMT